MESLILASHSARRMELLTLANIPFETANPEVDESCSLPPGKAVSVISTRKALNIGRLFPNRFILAADTLVSLDDQPFGKPVDEDDAVRMLKMLSGKTHQVYTGVTVITPSGVILTETDTSHVSFCEMTDREIVSYVHSGEPMDKAGSYAVQGRAALWITRIEGSYSSVMGLPLHLVYFMLNQGGYQFSFD